MATARAVERSLRRNVLDLCWGAWSELGVSGWSRTHVTWAIDPEPLIVFTAIADLDPRLRDEALDWCIRNSRHLSRVRLRHLVLQQPDSTGDKWGSFAATANAHARIEWPRASKPWPYTVTGRSILRPLSEPSMVLLRIRAMFGLGARSEILRCLLFSHNKQFTAAMLASATNYAKRNVAESCDTLVQAGVLATREVSRRYYYSLANPGPLADFVGALPELVVDWPLLLEVLGLFLEYANVALGASDQVRVIETHKVAERVEDALADLGLDVPDRMKGAAFLAAWDEWMIECTKELALGRWPGDNTYSTRLLV